MNRRNHEKGARQTRIFGLMITLISILLFMQACGTKTDPASGQAASVSPSASGSAEPKRNVPEVLNYGYIGTNKLNFPAGAEGWGFYKGIIQEELKKYGIKEVKLVGFPNGPDQSESLISGRLDFGSLGDTPAILARSTGAKTRLIAQTATDNIGYLIGKKNGPKTLADLKGKTVAIQKGSFMHRYISGLLKQNNITDVKLIHMLRVDAEAALARGEVDAMTTNGVYALKQIEQGYPNIDDANKHPDLLGSGVTVVSEDYLKKFPDFAKVWNAARGKALADLKAHEEEYYAFAAQLQSSTPELVKQTSPIGNIKDVPFTDAGTKLLEGTKQFLVDEKLAEQNFDLNAWLLKQ